MQSGRPFIGFFELDAEGSGFLEHAMGEMNFSARAHDRSLKVTRTITPPLSSPDRFSRVRFEEL